MLTRFDNSHSRHPNAPSANTLNENNMDIGTVLARNLPPSWRFSTSFGFEVQVLVLRIFI